MPSTAILEFLYEKESHSLLVWFVSGRAYRYLGVPEKLYKEMRAATSKGRYLNYKIKPSFACEKLKL